MPHKHDFPKKDAFKLPVNFKVIVPSTREKDIHINYKSFFKRVEDTKKFILKMFEGATIDTSIGAYKMEGQVVDEKVGVISVFTDKTQYERYDQELEKFLKEKKRNWSQDSMGYEYEGSLYFV